MGTEHKNTTDIRRVITFLEIQKVNSAMQRKHKTDVGSRAACTLRIVIGALHAGQKHQSRRDAAKEDRKCLVVADAWFGSVVCRGTEAPSSRHGGEYVICPGRRREPSQRSRFRCCRVNFIGFKDGARQDYEGTGRAAHLVMEQCCWRRTSSF
jgi:hypothetical protein